MYVFLSCTYDPKRTQFLQYMNIKVIKLLTRLRLNKRKYKFSHLNEHKFTYAFKDTFDPMWKCGPETVTTLPFLLRCRLYSAIRTELLEDICTVASYLTIYPDEKLLNIFLYESEYFNGKTNQSSLQSNF